MRIYVFYRNGDIYNERHDAISAKIVHEQMSFRGIFPYDINNDIQRGMRIGCEDGAGIFQLFEVRKVKTNEPEHIQEVTAEHIVISELTDEHCGKQEWTNITAGAALAPLLTGTGWSIGTNTASNLSSGDISFGDVWNATRTIQSNWNVYILPRIEMVTGRIIRKYLDIMPAEGTWRGFRISLEKNANVIGVTWDDSQLKTALYGYGQEKDGVPLTFSGVTWAATDDHPAKPEGQAYLEDPAATMNYGRNGRPRFGFYQNAGITDAATLLQKTWETLKTVRVPDVTVNSTIADLYRLGYVDVPIRLHDTALIEIRQNGPSGITLQKEIIQYTEDLLDPLQSSVVIGTYIPNIIYINRETARRSGAGRRGSGMSQTPAEYTAENNTVQIRIDSNGLDSLCVGIGAQLNPDGSLVVDEQGNPVFIEGGENLFSRVQQNKTNISLEVTNRQNADDILSGRIDVNAGQIALKVSKGDVATQLTVEVGNVSISNGNLVVSGYVTAAAFQAEQARFDNLVSGQSIATSIKATTLYGTNLSCSNLTIDSRLGFWSIPDMGDATIDGNAFSASQLKLDHYHKISMSESGGVVTVTTGKAANTAQTATFNIAATQFYLDAVAAAEQRGSSSVRITDVDGTDQGDPSSNVNPASITATASNGATYTRSLYMTQGSWNSSNQKAVNIRVGSTSGNLIGRLWITAPAAPAPTVGKPYIYNPSQNRICAVCVVNGQTYYGDYHNASEYT